MFAQTFLIFVMFFKITNSFSTNPRHGYSSRMSVVRSGRRNKAISWDLFENDEIPFDDSPKMSEIFLPKTPNQQQYYEDINNGDISLVIANGPAGTGKTLFPTQHAAKLLLETGKKVVLTRPLISVDEELGYLPGSINQKMDPWVIPIYDILREFFPQKTINTFIAEKRLEIVPLAFMRGRTFKDTFIIGDELQNSSYKQMLMLLTRLGENSKMIITGDINQCDNTENGLLDFVTRIGETYNIKSNPNFKRELNERMISIIELETVDIQRSAVISTILEIYDN